MAQESCASDNYACQWDQSIASTLGIARWVVTDYYNGKQKENGTYKGLKVDNYEERPGEIGSQSQINNESNQQLDSTRDSNVEVEGSSGLRRNRSQNVTHTFRTKTGEGYGWSDPNDAAKAFYLENEELYQGAKKNKELLGFLVKGSDGKYYYTDAFEVKDTYKFIGKIQDADGKELDEILISGPVKGILHSHPGGNFGSQEAFSEKDWRTADAGVGYYVRTPKGDMRFIDKNISASQDEDRYGMKAGVSLCGDSMCFKPYGSE